METKSGWENYLAEVPDLDMAQAALVRERVIRQVVAESSEPRDIVVDMLDAMGSMADEAVLDLMEGQPTTLRAALRRWLELVPAESLGKDGEVFKADLAALLDYPYPDEEALIQLHEGNRSTELEIKREVSKGDEEITIVLGGMEVGRLTEYDREGIDGTQVEEVMRDLRRAVLARIIPDRDHHVQLNSTDRRSLLAWLERPSGSWRPDDHKVRVSLDAVEGGGMLIRTRPYRHQPAADQPMRARVAADAYRDLGGGYTR